MHAGVVARHCITQADRWDGPVWGSELRDQQAVRHSDFKDRPELSGKMLRLVKIREKNSTEKPFKDISI